MESGYSLLLVHEAFLTFTTSPGVGICVCSSGIGYTATLHLARRGAKVYIGARNEQRAKAAIERMRAEGLQPGNGEVHWFQLDLSDPRKVKKSAEDFAAKEKRLDVLGTLRGSSPSCCVWAPQLTTSRAHSQQRRTVSEPSFQ